MLTTVSGVDVVVPTYRRPGLLRRCLIAIWAQRRPAARVIVVVRADDDPSKQTARDVAVGRHNLHLVEVEEPGVLAAMAVGIAASKSPVIAFTDDDASPRPDWLNRLMAHFEEPGIGGVGGRDVVRGEEGPLTRSVGQFTRYGKLIGNHHLGTGPPRDVEVLKGVNMAFRAEALALPAPGLLRGEGAQVDFEILSCAWARSQGWRLVYDPAALVDHEGAPRHGIDQRGRPTPEAIYDAAYNSVVAATALGGSMSLRRVAYPLIVGSHDRPGVLRGAVAIARRERQVIARIGPALSGRLAGVRARRMIGTPTFAVVTAERLREQT